MNGSGDFFDPLDFDRALVDASPPMPEATDSELMGKLVSLCKRRGFIFQSSEIYGGINGFWDYGPLGVELKRNVKEYWWRCMTREREDVVELDASIILHPQVWAASGHTSTFSDPMVDCKKCQGRFRADQLEEEACLEKPSKSVAACDAEKTEPRAFNLMFKTWLGPVESEENAAWLRPETAQAIFAQFKNVLDVSRQKLPFGICQIGKAFRNEINPRNYTFRSREFEQMELEYFIKPDAVSAAGEPSSEGEGEAQSRPEDWGWKEWHRYWVDQRMAWYRNIGLPEQQLKLHWQTGDELAHYAQATVDIMYRFPFGWQELEGIAARGDFDLRQHQQHSGKSLEFFDADTRQKYLPQVIEPSAGVDRLVLALLCQAYGEEMIPNAQGKPERRIVMKFHPRMAPCKVGVFPLNKNRPPLVAKAKAIHDRLKDRYLTAFDLTGSIGKRYARHDEIGTPFGVTVDFDTVGDGESDHLKDTVTVRDRDTTQQTRVPIAELESWLAEKLA